MPKKKSQQSLEKWTKEKWGTSDGKPAERKTKSGKTKTELKYYAFDLKNLKKYKIC